ncbi:MAG: (d)CMP kinase [Lachnospiraceae bacterium]|jgi:cytidylate kinase|nr:(d)CMP kinase [Lachnospiraceae bacterium]MCR4684820.1 (d)CMP kinase [Lachnospiraceae bacterium]
MNRHIAIDGPAGAGKSTIAKAVAKKKGLIYVDTGAMYRAFGLYLLRQQVDVNDQDAVIAACERADVSIAFENNEQVVLLNGENVNGQIRTEEVGNMASACSTIPRVREIMVERQQQIAREKDVIMDGRDIGTVVLPDAKTKIYLTASSKVRAKRRYDELKEKGVDCDLKKIEADIIERDERDMNRAASPLRQADDAILVDTSDLSIDEVIAKILELSDG